MNSQHAMVVRTDARAMGAITALGAPMRQAPRFTDYRTNSRAGECISYFGTTGMSDDELTTARDKAVLFKSVRAERRSTRRASNADAAKRSSVDISLMAKMGTIHASNDI